MLRILYKYNCISSISFSTISIRASLLSGMLFNAEIILIVGNDYVNAAAIFFPFSLLQLFGFLQHKREVSFNASCFLSAAIFPIFHGGYPASPPSLFTLLQSVN